MLDILFKKFHNMTVRIGKIVFVKLKATHDIKYMTTHIPLRQHCITILVKFKSINEKKDIFNTNFILGVKTEC